MAQCIFSALIADGQEDLKVICAHKDVKSFWATGGILPVPGSKEIISFHLVMKNGHREDISIEVDSSNRDHCFDFLADKANKYLTDLKMN